MSAVFSATAASPALRRAKVLHLFSQPLLLRAVLLVVSIVAGLAAGALADPAGVSHVEPELVVLLRGMALIKAGMALLAFSLAWWRFGSPMSSQAAAGCVAGVGCLAAATILIWYLSFILAAAVVFHLGLFGLLVLAWREGRSAWSPRRRASSAGVQRRG